MSMPIPCCVGHRAAKGDEVACEAYIRAMTVNLSCGHWTVGPCPHNPPCESASQEQVDKFNAKIKEHFEKNPVKCESGPSGVSGFSAAHGSAPTPV